MPFFHITKHGLECIKLRDILPYDIDGFIAQINDIEGITYYLTEALNCYNANCYNACTMMIGLASETIVELLINNFSTLLGKTRYEIALNPKQQRQSLL